MREWNNRRGGGFRLVQKILTTSKHPHTCTTVGLYNYRLVFAIYLISQKSNKAMFSTYEISMSQDRKKSRVKGFCMPKSDEQ